MEGDSDEQGNVSSDNLVRVKGMFLHLLCYFYQGPFFPHTPLQSLSSFSLSACFPFPLLSFPVGERRARRPALFSKWRREILSNIGRRILKMKGGVWWGG